MSNEYLSNDFPAPIEVCKCGRCASIDCMIAVSDGYKCISCVEKELHDQVPISLLTEIDSYRTSLFRDFNNGIARSIFKINSDLNYILSKYRKGGDDS